MKTKTFLILYFTIIVSAITYSYIDNIPAPINKYPYITKERYIEFDESISYDGNSIGITYWLWYDGKIINCILTPIIVKQDMVRVEEERLKIWANDQIMFYSHLDHEK